ncbi:putative bifunctional diguanylate cyclase/phosphodiesterase [Amycolatopsis minnesotensis]|uniref:EAL domain-containing protein n=1 Tax=Amycolatopsis minnesotensis TaxID=337894 RepID=A0ABP5D2X8_9PSEU
MPNPQRKSPAPSPDGVREQELLARKWAYLLSGVVVVSMGKDELDRELRYQLATLCSAVVAEPVDADAARGVGERLVALGYVGDPGLRCTMDVLGKGMLGLSACQPLSRFAERITAVLGALASGFVAATRSVVLEQQEIMQLSLLKAVRDAKWHLKESEARFEEVATSSTSGIMVIELDGKLSKANAALGEILGVSPAKLTGTTVYDLVRPESVEALREGMAALLTGERERFRQSQQLRRADGDTARISLTVSLLRDAEDQPRHFVGVVEDGTELMLLQGELHRQSLHDVLTGLPNRQYFGTHLESVLRRADPALGITVLHLDLDAFAKVCDSLGRRAGEQLLVQTSRRLKAVFAQEKAMIARFDGDEFGIVVENSARTPDVSALVANINAELFEPSYVEGEGLALPASIGVVHRPPHDSDPAELLRAADSALRRAKTGRRGQWELFHPDQDAVDRRAQLLAVGMPGAWEHGEITVRYRPVKRLADGEVAGVEAVLHWDRPGHGTVPHHRCVELADQTGLMLPLGEWVLRTACGQLRWWRQQLGFSGSLMIGLSVNQAGDADLVRRVLGALAETGAEPGWLTIGIPAAALTAAEAQDNLTVLADRGITMMLDDIGPGAEDLALLAELPVHAVRITRRHVDGRARLAAAALVPLIRESSASVHIDGVGTPEQAAWWHATGAGTATGEHVGTPRPAAEIATVLGAGNER